MAVSTQYTVPITGRKVYTWLTTDTKPSAVAGSVGFDDAGAQWLCYGSTDWRQSGTGGAAHTYDATLRSGERNVGTSNDYQASVPECNATVLDGTGAVSVSSSTPALLYGILIITSATTATIVGAYDQNYAAKSIVLTASSASQFFDLKGMKVDDTFTVTASVDDDVVVFWRPQ